MRYRMIFLILVAALLAGCQGRSATQAETYNATQAPEAAASPAADTVVVATQPSKTAAPETAAPETTAPETVAPETAAPIAQAAPPGCTVISPPPTPGATSQSLFPAVSEKDWVNGPDGAAITFTEYSDFQ